jgi:hypothetical protein
MSWTYLDMPESSTCAGTENRWYAMDLVQSPGTSCCGPFPFARFHTYYTQIVIII